MYKCGKLAIDALQHNNVQTARIQVYPDSGTGQKSITLTDEDIVSGGLTVDRYCVSSSKIEIGSAIAAQLTLRLDNYDSSYDDYIFEGAELYATLYVEARELFISLSDELVVDEDDYVVLTDDFFIDNEDCIDGFTYEEGKTLLLPIPLGYFIVDGNPRPLTAITITALDRMVRFDKEINSQIVFKGRTIENIINQCCSICNVSLSGNVRLSRFPNYNYVVSSTPESTNTITYRTIIQWCAAIMGTCAFMNADGHLEFAWYTPTGLDITPSNRTVSDLYENDITLTGVSFSREETTGETTTTVTYKSDNYDETYALDITGNLLIQSNPKRVLDGIESALRGFSYRPYSATVFPSPYLFPLDMITFVDNNGNRHSTIVTNVTFTMNQNTTIAGKGETTQTVSYSPTGLTTFESQVIEKMNRKVASLSSRQQATVELNEMIANSMGLQLISVDDGAGGYKHYFCNGRTLAESNIIYTIQSGGFAWTTDWNNGAPVWKYGFTATGNAVLNVLSAYGINADWIKTGVLNANLIKTGTFEVSDPDGNVVFSANARGQLYTPVKIGGWNVNRNAIYYNSGSEFVNINGTGENFLTCGYKSDGKTVWPLTVTRRGALYATGAVIEGEITAESGVIGGWTITTDAIYIKSNSGEYTFLQNEELSDKYTDYVFGAGASSVGGGDAKFYVRPNGEIRATSGTIGGCKITEVSLNCYGTDDRKACVMTDGGLDFYYNQSKTGFIHAIKAPTGGHTTLVMGASKDVDSDIAFMHNGSLRLTIGSVAYNGIIDQYTSAIHALWPINMNGRSIGHVGAIDYNSDARLKENISDSTIQALDNVVQMRFRQFDWKESGKHEPIGLVAQELKEIEPKYVNTPISEEGTHTINLNRLVMTALKAVQEQQKEIDFLKERIEKLEREDKNEC